MQKFKEFSHPKIEKLLYQFTLRLNIFLEVLKFLKLKYESVNEPKKLQGMMRL